MSVLLSLLHAMKVTSLTKAKVLFSSLVLSQLYRVELLPNDISHLMPSLRSFFRHFLGLPPCFPSSALELLSGLEDIRAVVTKRKLARFSSQVPFYFQPPS